MDPRLQLIQSAQTLGMSPLDLATIISYETAGTFDPRKKGPTTQWGQHEGYIQFGEPQAQQYGVDWNNPVASQLGPQGAVVNYFQGNGWQPGMGLMDAYSIVNAGAPGRYNASDAANGGAWGTVADKVNHQFGPHREKAAAFLGGDFAAQFSKDGMTPGGFAGPLDMGVPASAPLSPLAGMFSDPAPQAPNQQAQAKEQAESERRRKEALFGGPLFG